MLRLGSGEAAMKRSEWFTVGSIECRIVGDGSNFYGTDFLFPGVARDDWAPLLQSQLDEQGQVSVPYNPLLVRTGGELVLIDAGLGELAKELGLPCGRLMQSLRDADVRPQDISMVVVSHAHPDHIGGLSETKSGERLPVFTAARHYFWKSEWEFWSSEESLATLPEVMAGPARIHLPVIKDAGLVELIAQEQDIVPGVRLMPAPGHTPGHMVVGLSSRDQKAVFAADTVIHEVNFHHPEWMSASDALPEMALTTRRRLLEGAARDGSLFIAFHLDHSGHIEKHKDGYRFRQQQSHAPLTTADN
jgi:glyoxylase-like metal-dependent hydrolase (beta-lactamase superfamily II)